MRIALLFLLAALCSQQVSAQSFKWLGHPTGVPPFEGTFWESLALGVSGDGTVIGDFREFNGPFGGPYLDTAWSWKEGTFTTLPFTRANHITLNSHVILGEHDLRDEQGGFISTESVKWEFIDEDENSVVSKVTPSVDGPVIELNDEMSAMQLANGKWKEVGDFTNFRVNAVSADRSTFVGVKYPGLPDDTTARAAVWTADEEILLPLIPGTEDFYKVHMYALAVSGDGSTVVGYIDILYNENSAANNAYFAFIWTKENGSKTIIEAAVNAGIEWNFDAWDPEQATAISTTGKYIAGWGDLDGENLEPWLLELDFTPREPIVVNVVGDDADADPNDGVIDVDLDEPGEQISLRAAIEAANEDLGLDRIEFDIEGPSPINLGAVFELPVITDLVEIDGATQDPTSTTPPIWLQFSGDAGLTVTGGDCLIRGLVISGSDIPNKGQFNSENLSHGIVLRGLGGNTIDFCFIGTNTNGSNSRSIQGAGIFIDNAPDNTVSNCLLSGNWWAGVAVKGVNAFGNRIEGNLVGTNATGDASIFTNIEISGNSANSSLGLEGNLGNGPPDLDFLVANIVNPEPWWLKRAGGIVIENAPSNVISGNRISGNNWGGIIMVGPATTNTVVQSNNLGYDPETESPSLRNVPGGNIRVIDSPNNLIGGNTPSLGNQIHGIGIAIDIYGDPVRAGGMTIDGPGSINNRVQGNLFRDLLGGVFIGREASENSISKNNIFLDCVEAGITIQGFENTVAENSFGGAEDLRRARWGVIVDGDNNVIGGDSIELGNQFINPQFGDILCGLGTGNTFRYNSHEYVRPRIELWGTSSRIPYGTIKTTGHRDPDRNDRNDNDTGGNNQLNHPSINITKTQGLKTTVTGFLDTSQHLFSNTYTLDFYESGIHVGEGTVDIGVAGLAKYDSELSVAVSPGKYINATATGLDGSTSEFGKATRVEGSISTDADGVSDEVENLVPNKNQATTSSALGLSTAQKASVRAEEGFGDGNGDGILDSEQDWVASFPIYTGEFLTIESEKESVKLLDVSSFGPDWIAFSNIDAPLGIIDFSVSDFTEIRTVVEFSLPADSALDEIWYFGPTTEDPAPHWFEFTFDGTTGAEILEDRLRLHFVDGQRGDTDLEINGVISTSILPVKIGPGEPGLEVNPIPNTPSVTVTWPLRLTDPLLENSINMADWEVISDDPQTIDGRKSLEQNLQTNALFFRLTAEE